MSFSGRVGYLDKHKFFTKTPMGEEYQKLFFTQNYGYARNASDIKNIIMSGKIEDAESWVASSFSVSDNIFTNELKVFATSNEIDSIITVKQISLDSYQTVKQGKIVLKTIENHNIHFYNENDEISNKFSEFMFSRNKQYFTDFDLTPFR